MSWTTNGLPKALLDLGCCEEIPITHTMAGTGLIRIIYCFKMTNVRLRKAYITSNGLPHEARLRPFSPRFF